MEQQHALLLLVAAVAIVCATSTAVSEAASVAELSIHGHGGRRTADAAGWMRPGPSSCGGALVEECLGGQHEVGGGDGGAFCLGARRRQLVDDGDGDGDGYPTQYISYAALMRNSVPCSVPGASYYNCHPGAVANPYTRGCSAITQCRD